MSQPHEVVLHSKRVGKDYFASADRAPRSVPEPQDDGTTRVRWIFDTKGFKYSSFYVGVPTRTILEDVVNVNGKNEPIYPKNAKHSGETVKQILTDSDEWPSWISFNRTVNKLFSLSHAHQASWTCHCAQDDCPTQFEVTVSLSEATNGVQKTPIYVKFLTTPCKHWAHKRAGGLTQVDKDKFNRQKPIQAWEQNLTDCRSTEKQLFGNTDGVLKNVKQARNIRAAHTAVPLPSQYDVFDLRWMGQLVQYAFDSKFADIDEDERGLEWNEIGWVQANDDIYRF